MATAGATNGLATPPTSSMCKNEAQFATLIGLCVVWPFAIAVTAFLAIAQKRTRFRPEGFYKGRPGLPIPIDFLVSPRQRLMYSILFGVMGTGILVGYGNFRIGNYVRLEGDDPYTKVLNKILWTPFFTVLDLSLRYFPLFATVGFPYPGLGYTVGFVYSVVWFLAFWIPHFIYYDDLVSCTPLNTNTGRSVIVANVMRDLPLLLMSILVMFWFAYRALFHCVWKPLRKNRGMSEDFDGRRHGIRRYHFDRVKHLLVKEEPKKISFEKSNKVLRVLRKIRKYLFPFKRNYKLPLPLVGAIVAMVLLIYQLSCGVVSVTFILLSELAPYYTDVLKPGLDSLAGSTNSSVPQLTSDIAGALFIGVPVIIALAPFGAVAVCVFLLIHMVSSISKQIKKASKVGFSEQLPGRVRRVSGVWRYIGLQIGLFITSWIIFTILFAIIGLILILGFFCLKYPAPRSIVLNIGIILIVPLVWAQVLWFMQALISKHIFVEDKGKDDEAKFIPVNNKRLYNWFAFVLFFYNGFAGLVGAVQRILFNVVFGLILLFRLDKLSIPAEFAWWDFGHNAYLSFIYLDYCYNNPVVHVFSRLLENSIHTKPDDKTLSNVELVGADQLTKTNVQARNRWQVAYTLIRNPCLQKLTASNIRLLQASAERDKKSVFSLRQTIRSFSQEDDNDIAINDVFVKKTGLEFEVDIGREITSPEEMDKEMIKKMEPDKNEAVNPEDEKSDVPYQKWT